MRQQHHRDGDTESAGCAPRIAAARVGRRTLDMQCSLGDQRASVCNIVPTMGSRLTQNRDVAAVRVASKWALAWR